MEIKNIENVANVANVVVSDGLKDYLTRDENQCEVVNESLYDDIENELSESDSDALRDIVETLAGVFQFQSYDEILEDFRDDIREDVEDALDMLDFETFYTVYHDFDDLEYRAGRGSWFHDGDNYRQDAIGVDEIIKFIQEYPSK